MSVDEPGKVRRDWSEWNWIQSGIADAVSVATSHHLHAQMALACLEAGLHVFVEKPLATRITDADKRTVYCWEPTKSRFHRELHTHEDLPLDRPEFEQVFQNLTAGKIRVHRSRSSL